MYVQKSGEEEIKKNPGGIGPANLENQKWFGCRAGYESIFL